MNVISVVLVRNYGVELYMNEEVKSKVVTKKHYTSSILPL